MDDLERCTEDLACSSGRVCGQNVCKACSFNDCLDRAVAHGSFAFYYTNMTSGGNCKLCDAFDYWRRQSNDKLKGNIYITAGNQKFDRNLRFIRLKFCGMLYMNIRSFTLILQVSMAQPLLQ